MYTSGKKKLPFAQRPVEFVIFPSNLNIEKCFVAEVWAKSNNNYIVYVKKAVINLVAKGMMGHTAVLATDASVGKPAIMGGQKGSANGKSVVNTGFM